MSSPYTTKPTALIISVGSDDFLKQLSHNVCCTLTDTGYETTCIDLVKLQYDPAMTKADRNAYHTEQPIVHPLVRRHADLVLATNILVFIYPSIWGTMPALLKGWIDRTFVIGVALKLEGGKVRRNLTKVNHVVGIATSSAKASDATKAFRDHGRLLITRTIPIITKRRAKKYYWHHTRAGIQADEAFIQQVTDRLKRLKLPQS